MYVPGILLSCGAFAGLDKSQQFPFQNLVPAHLVGTVSSTATALCLTTLWSAVDSLLTLGAPLTSSPGCVATQRATLLGTDQVNTFRFKMFSFFEFSF